MSEEKGGSRRKKDQLADALAGMAGGAPAVDPMTGDAPQILPDDQTIAPPPTIGSFVKKRPVASKALDRGIETRRTLIPVLLTMGVLLPAVGSLKWLSAPESPFAAWPTRGAMALIVAGIVLLSLALVNMASVKRMLQQRQRHGV